MTPPRPRTHALTALTAGHAAVAVAAVVVAGLLIFDGMSRAAADRTSGARLAAGLAVVVLAAGIGVLAAGQLLSMRRVAAHSRATSAGRLDEAALAAGVRRIPWTVSVAFYPVILGLLHLLLNPPPPVLLAALLAVLAASMLLDGGHAAWSYRRLPLVNGTRFLPPGSRRRIADGQRITAALYVGCAVAATALLAATVVDESTRPFPSPLGAAVQIAAALGTALVPLLLLRPVLWVSSAITTTPHGADLVGLDALDRAARPFLRLPGLAAPVALLAVAALATATSPALAAGRALPLLLVLGSAAVQLASLTSIALGDTAPAARAW